MQDGGTRARPYFSTSCTEMLIFVSYATSAWSPPSFISPNNFSAGLMLGLDVYNAILVLRTEEAVKGFRTHNLTLGSDLGIAAGPLGGAGISGEMGLKKGSVHKTPIFSYVQSKGFYAGVSLVGQAFLDRFDENERVYQYVLLTFSLRKKTLTLLTSILNFLVGRTSKLGIFSMAKCGGRPSRSPSTSHSKMQKLVLPKVPT